MTMMLPQTTAGTRSFVYDGGNDIGRIYLDGQLDWEGGKRAPNGGGHLIIGARNNGEAQYRGLIDDVAIWNEALATTEVAELAAGGSPISSLADEDGDGFADVWENKYAGNLTDFGAGVYSQTFSAPDGSTDLGDGSVFFGQAASVQDNALRLTIDGQGLGFSSFSVPAIAGSSAGWTASFDYELLILQVQTTLQTDSHSTTVMLHWVIRDKPKKEWQDVQT